VEVCICLRPTLDWGDEAAVHAGLDPEFRPKMEAWDATFSLPYARFRQRLTEIARENWSRVRDARVVGLDDVPDGCLAVPVDDDDWFAPDLVARLRVALDGRPRGLLWTRWILEARPWGLRRLRGRRAEERFTCGSNNYAVVTGGTWTIALPGHGKASRQFDAHPDRVRRIDARLSVQNRNLSSQTVLGWRTGIIPRSRLRRRYRRYRRLYDPTALPPDLAWAQPCVEAMAGLMADLRWTAR